MRLSHSLVVFATVVLAILSPQVCAVNGRLRTLSARVSSLESHLASLMELSGENQDEQIDTGIKKQTLNFLEEQNHQIDSGIKKLNLLENQQIDTGIKKLNLLQDNLLETEEQEAATSSDDPIRIDDIPSFTLARPDLVPSLTISSSASSQVYPPNSISVKNIGTVASQPTKAKLWCVSWTKGYPAQIIPGNVIDGHGVCFSSMTLNVPSIPAGGAVSLYSSLPFNPFPISCTEPAGMCDVHFQVDTVSANAELSENNNHVAVTKTTVKPWP